MQDRPSCILLDLGDTVEGVHMPSYIRVEAGVLGKMRETGRCFGVRVGDVEGDVIRFALANGTWIYRIGARVENDGRPYYEARWVD